MSLAAWVVALGSPLLLYHLFHRLSYAHGKAPPYDLRLHALVASLAIRPGDIVLCVGCSPDSYTVAGWSLSRWTHVAVIGRDYRVHDITPGEDRRRMTLLEYVHRYEGHVCWLPRLEAAEIRWGEPTATAFRANAMALLIASHAHRPTIGSALRATLGGYDERRRDDGFSFCSEFVARMLGLPQPTLTHPADFAPGGRFGYRTRIVLLHV